MMGRIARWAIVAAVPVLAVLVLLTRNGTPPASRWDEPQQPAGVESKRLAPPDPARVEAAANHRTERGATGDRPRQQAPRRRQRSGYDPERLETVRGKVVAATRPGRPSRVVPINPLILETADGRIAVRLGPPGFVRSLGLGLAAGDQLEVRGTRVKTGPRDSILAASITKDGQVVQLRDHLGHPVWRRPPRSADAEAAPR